ncbi:coiled-coil and C2 domain-containing protein 1A-like isoform X1 [Alosa sapidissima]|uniref:coiled-coil and C2 domain-containing protein 1A-like isoform X1 n=2 Tax=Alosa sapidissima TaxID=34773 RepID=UPI001C08FAA1|nr:coiled-coil and C2 domain-containing protein 1A-like isoform X1 [Alosa sapidissima]
MNASLLRIFVLCKLRDRWKMEEQPPDISEGQSTGGNNARTHPERLALLCMKVILAEEDDHGDGEEEEGLESDTDLLAELNELLNEDGAENFTDQTEPNTPPHSTKEPSTSSQGLEVLLIGRIGMYRAAIRQASSAKAVARTRRYRRGLKTLEAMLESARRGHPVSETEIPPPVVVTPSKPSACQKVQPVIEEKYGSFPGMLSSTDDPTLSNTTDTESTPLVWSRLKEYKLAALQAKQTGDMELAKHYYLTAKKLESIVEALKEGEFPEIRSLPPPPGQIGQQSGAEDESPLLSHDTTGEENYATPQACWEPNPPCGPVEIRSCLPTGSPVLPQTEDSYTHLIDLFLQQQQRCLSYCQQFSHMGNIEETIRFEELAETSAQHAEILRESQRRGYAVPKYHTEECIISTFKINPDLTGNELELIIVKGINLPAVTDISSAHLDTSVRFEFQFPSLEEAQKNQTRPVKDSVNPVFDEHFKLFLKKDHRAFKRVIQSKGIKFEILQKEGLFKTDKVVGSGQLKLDSLDTQCEIRQIIEVMNRRKTTGGHLELQVRVREPLGGLQPHEVTEHWLVLDSLPIPLVVAPKSSGQEADRSRTSVRSSTCLLL